MAKILQSPIILPPESISKNTITRQAFSLGRAFAVTFQISSSNLKLIATESTDENGEIITEYTSEPDTDKELGFSIFLTDDTDAHTFGASAGRCGWIDYSTKGEVAEGINDNGDKVIVDFEDNSTKSDLDLLLDHVYPENINNLVKNQTPGLKSIFSMLFLSNKTFFNSVTDVYGNLYYDSLIVDADGNVTDFLTGELKPISEYQAPVIIQYSIGENIHYMVYDFIFEDKPIDILNINYYTFRLLFENHGGILTLEIMKPGETFYRPCMTKELPYNYYGNHNIRFGFGQFTPLFSYDIDKKANFNIHNIQLQQSDERPDWLKTLDKELKNLLDMETFNTELLGAENKLILHTDRISNDKLETINTLLEQVVPQNIEVVHTNYFLPDGYKELEYLEKEKQCVLKVPYTPEESLYVRLKYMTYLNDGGQIIMSGTSTTKDKLASIQEGFSRLNVRINNIANNFALDASQPCEHTYWPHRNLVKIGDTVSELTNKLTGTLPGGIMTFFGDYTDRYALKGRVYNVEIGNDSGKVKNLIPCVDNVGAPCFFDIVEYQTYYHSGRLDFIIPGQEYAIQTLDLDLEAKSYAQLTEHGVRRLYHVPKGCNMTKDEYAAANGFKEIVEPPMPQTGYWRPEWRETETQIVLDWIETEEPMEVNEND